MKRKHLTILIFGIAVAAGFGLFILYETMPHYYQNPNIPQGFLYTTQSDRIPQQYLIYYQNAFRNNSNSDLNYEDGKFSCISNKLAPSKIDYFSYSPAAGTIGGWSSRYALICGNSYWIVHAADFGIYIYGPFRIPAYQ